MVELQWVVNEATRDRVLYYRQPETHTNKWGVTTYTGRVMPWTRVPEVSLEESSLQDLIESGGIVGAP